VGTDLNELPQGLVDMAVFMSMSYGPGMVDLRRVIAATVDWLREHPAEAARLLGTRTPTSWDV
jgi:hypothetical protein